jgi:hypothetical protein
LDFSIHFTNSTASNPYIRNVKQLFIVFAILLQSICGSSAVANSAVTINHNTQENSIAFSIPDEEPSALRRTLKITRNVFKTRVARIYSVDTGITDQPDPFYHDCENVISAYASPLYIPLVRHLLFPKHYFW